VFLLLRALSGYIIMLGSGLFNDNLNGIETAGRIMFTGRRKKQKKTYYRK